MIQTHIPEEDDEHSEIIIITDFSEESEDIAVNINQDEEDLEEILTYEDYNEVDVLDDLVIKSELTEESNDITYKVFEHLDSENDLNRQEKKDKLENDSRKQFNKAYFSSRKREFSSKGKPNKRNMRKVQLDRHYICEECGEDCSNDKYAFNLHKMKHKKSKCKICGIIIRTDNMGKHLDCHTSGPRVCDLCGVTCKNTESLRGHIFYMHRKAADEYKCDQCSKSYRMKYKLEEHKIKEHIGE